MQIMDKQYYIYILTSNNKNVLYTGITNDLVRRVYEHKNKLQDSFTSKYNVNQLVDFEIFSDPISAIEREKQIKGGSRKKKIALIMSKNSEWEDLYYGLL